MANHSNYIVFYLRLYLKLHITEKGLNEKQEQIDNEELLYLQSRYTMVANSHFQISLDTPAKIVRKSLSSDLSQVAPEQGPLKASTNRVRNPGPFHHSSHFRLNLNKIRIHIISTVKMLFLVVFSRKLGISDDMSTGYM
ncbi:hypothetical protein TNCV_4697191 [Trichonephila clavipes]|nr:hypothetical protein TNCV_4697191 [Trichonephila clavipes]